MLDSFPAKTRPLFTSTVRQRNERALRRAADPAHGINVAVPGYTLGPTPMTQIVDRSGIAAFLAAQANARLRPPRLFVGGWSPADICGGGHRPSGCRGQPADQWHLDLEPIALGVLNDKLSLSPGKSRS